MEHKPTAAPTRTHASHHGQPQPQVQRAHHVNFHESTYDSQGSQTLSKSATDSSEGGHDLTKIAPLAKHHGSSVAQFFNGLFTTMIALATLGTSITFSYVLSNQTSPPPMDARYDANQVQFFLAVSWLLFLICLAVASLGSTLLTFFKKHWIKDWDGEHGRRSQLTVQLYAVGISATMGSLTVAAFVFLCLVIVAYQAVVGWISLGFTGFFGVIVAISICNQVPWPWIQGRTPTESFEEKDNSSLV